MEWGADFSPCPIGVSHAHISGNQSQKRCTLSAIETDRWILHSRIREVLGSREGDILMEHLPPAGWSHLATRDDVTMARVDLRAEIAQMTADLRLEMTEMKAELRLEMAEMKTELRSEMAEMKTELKGDIAQLRIDMEKGFRAQTWKMVAAMGTSQAISVAIMAAMVNSLR
jgi:hypothetical protein